MVKEYQKVLDTYKNRKLAKKFLNHHQGSGETPLARKIYETADREYSEALDEAFLINKNGY